MNADLHTLTPDELGKLFPISIEPYDPGWVDLFNKERQNLGSILGSEIALRIEHFGSTSVPGLSAKPTIDIIVEIPERLALSDAVIHIMKTHKYEYIRRNDFPPPYMMFVKGYTPHGFEGQSYHIHMAPAAHGGLWDRLYFKDYLKENKKLSTEYELLKNELAGKYKYDREKYTEGKAGFIEKITKEAKQHYEKRL
jgi:GrpB-like predicted nucleotidyltransferase (UPF0157 family)